MNIICDWSGTLSNDFPIVCKAVNRVLTHFNLPNKTGEYMKTYFELPYINFYRKIGYKGTLEEIKEIYNQEFSESIEPELFSYAKNVIKKVHKTNDLYIVSSHPKRNLDNEIIGHQIKDYFKGIYAEKEDKSDALRNLIKNFKLNPENIIYFADMDYDIRIAKECNIFTIAVTYGYHKKERLEKEEPNVLIDSIIQLPDAIKKIKEMKKSNNYCYNVSIF